MKALMNRPIRPLVSSLALVLPLATSGCIFGSGFSDDERSHEELRSCWNGASEEEVVDNVQLSFDYGQSLHEMVACGGLAVAVCTALVSGIVSAIQQGTNDATPDGWTFEDGIYRTEVRDGGQTTTMTMQFFAGKDYAFAAQGEPILEDIFLIDNYLVGALVTVDLGAGTATLTYDEVGPLVGLLGFGPMPENPKQLSLNDLDAVGRSLGALEFVSEVMVVDEQNNSVVDYTTRTGQLSANDLLDGVPLVFDIINADGARDDLGQTLTVDSWTIDYNSAGGLLGLGGGTLNGTSAYRVEGGHFDYRGTITFEDSTEGETELSCE